MKMKSIISLFLALNLTILSQWTSNTNLNTVVCDTTGEQTLVKISLCPDGSTFYTWFDNRGGGYAVYIQKLDVNGVRQFPANGILVSNNPQNSSLVDYDLIADESGNAILVFTDTRNGLNINPYAYKISPTGIMLWGVNGITLSDSVNAYQPNPKVVQTTDDGFVFIWRLGQGPAKLAMQKLNSVGIKQWGSSPVILSSGTTENYDWPSIVRSNDARVVIMWSGYSGTFINPINYKIYSQQFSSAGTRLWQDTIIYSLGRVSGFYQPKLFRDWSDGTIYCWRDDRNSQNLQTGYIQRRLSYVNQFPANGSPVSTLAGFNHFDPIAAYMDMNGQTYAFWYESNSLQSQYGVYGQKFNLAGNLMWGSSGIAFSPLSSNQPSSFSIAIRDTNVFCYYQQTAGGVNYLVKAFRIGMNGGFAWSGNILTPCSLLSEKLRTAAVLNITNGMSVIAWCDRRNDAGGIYAQNINFNGTFGLVGIKKLGTEIPGNFYLGQNYPNPFNPAAKIKFNIPLSRGVSGRGVFTKIEIYDILGREVLTLVEEELKPGSYEVSFDGSNLTSGVYYCRMNAGGFADTKKMLLVK